MAINSFPDNSGGPVNFPDQFIDPVSKFRVSNPENLIDTDFEYGLQPTKWETVELINNTPSFFSKSGDTTIDGISSIITNAGTREIIVKTELDHGLAVGIPINVTGTKSITADGAYIINSIPDPQTFTYLCKDNQSDTNSILDLYSSIITGEFFQGSQLRISDSDGIVTDAEGTSILTVTTNTTHGFGENTPFYFLNLNSTVAQEFQAANTASKSFDASNSATAQTFDGSNSLSSVNIDWSNSATFGGVTSTISATNQAADTITVTHQAGENFNNLPLGSALYYSVSATGGYFNTNPRGIVFLKTITGLGTSTSTFQVSAIPNGNAIDLTSNLSGTFQIANQARTFAGNNINPLTQTVLDIEVGDSFSFDGGNQGYSGEVQETPPNNTLTILSYDGLSINADGSSASDHYVGSMVRYASTGTAATGLTANTTYFITSFTNNTGGNYTFSVAALPGGTPISIPAGSGSGTQTFTKIGVSLDKDIVHIKNSGFSEGDMLQYTFPVDGRFVVSAPEEEKIFYFVDTAYDSHNYKISEDLGFKPIVATGGTVLTDTVINGRTYRIHQFTTTGNTNFVVSDPGKESLVEYLVVAGGGGGGRGRGGGGGAGGYRTGSLEVDAATYTVTVGSGGAGSTNTNNGANGGNSVFSTITALGGGGGGTNGASGSTFQGSTGGSGGGSSTWTLAGGLGTVGQGNNGGGHPVSWQTNSATGGGGGAGGPGGHGAAVGRSGHGGPGQTSFITGSAITLAGGGGGGGDSGDNQIAGVGQAGGGNGGIDAVGGNATANTGSGGGGGGRNAASGTESNGGNGGSGIVILRYPITPPVPLVPASATGGTITEVVDSGVTYKVHTFTSVGSSNFVVSSTGSWNEFEYLILAGGGGGGRYGGGGAGGLLQGRLSSLTPQTYAVVVGGGGNGGNTIAEPSGRGVSGSNSSAFGLTAIGGGSGGDSGAGGPGLAGGSGGGGGYEGNAGGARTSGQGNVGTSGTNNGTSYTGGTGGGAGATGSISRPINSGDGGNGLRSKISGYNIAYAAGGGGPSFRNEDQTGLGGSNGVGGLGGKYGTSGPQSVTGWGGYVNRGSGGSSGYPGSAGVVIIRYPIAVSEPVYMTATGGTESTITVGSTVYKLHTFTTVGTSTFEITNVGNVGNVEYLLVAGGGGGAGSGGSGSGPRGGGGAGGMLTDLELPLPNLAVGSYNVVIGAGGAGGANTSEINGTNGQNSSFGGTLVAIGGGGGGTYYNSGAGPGLAGGSGGGSAYNYFEAAGTQLQGNRGRGAANGAGGGGGAGGMGRTKATGDAGGDGGIGRQSSITGTATYYAGGGGAGGYTAGANNWGNGGLGGGGRGASGGQTAVAGTANTGGGGGAGGSGAAGAAGGSGIFIIRYPIGTA